MTSLGQARHQDTSVEELESLSWHINCNVRIAVAGNCRTPTKALVQLARSSFSPMPHRALREALRDLRSALICNPNTPLGVKMWLLDGYSGMSLEDFLEATNAD